jgi:prevent-host-death family protein
MKTTSVGIREAKMHLSRYLKQVQQGREIILTDRGRPVGRIVPVEPAALPLTERLRRLTEKGMLEFRHGPATSTVGPPIPVKDDVARRYLEEDRAGG